MMRLISEIVELVGIILVVLGLVVCMCDTDMDKQFITGLYGLGIMAVGAVICYLGKEGSEYYGN